MIIKELAIKDKEVYNKLVNHPLQSYEWGEFRKKLGQKVIRTGVFEKNKLISAFQLFFHQVPKTPFSVGYFPKGLKPTKLIVEALKKLGKENNAIFIKLEPNVLSGQSVSFETSSPGRCISFAPRKFGLIPGRPTISPQAISPHGCDSFTPLVNSSWLSLTPGKPIFTKYSSVIDLTLSEEELLAKMHPKTRYNLRLAEKKEVTVKEDNSPKAFNEYLKLLFETTKRQGFYAHSEKFHRLQWQLLQPAGISHLLVAKYQGKILAAFLLFVFKDTLYYPYGASTREHKELMAPTLLMWEAIKFGKKMGLKKFDLWGDLEPNPPPNHPYYGFHRFKKGFSPKLVEFIGTYDLVINPTLYKIYKTVDSLRWKILRLKAKI